MFFGGVFLGGGGGGVLNNPRIKKKAKTQETACPKKIKIKQQNKNLYFISYHAKKLRMKNTL